MTSAISTSLSGLQSATQRLNVAATNIVLSGNPEPEKQSTGEVINDKPAQSGSPARINFSPLPDLTSSIVDLKIAEISYKASAKALKVALEIDKHLIDEIR